MVLDEAAKLFPTEWSIHYNLACYCAQLDAAQEHLHKSYELGDAKQIKLIALDDEDLMRLPPFFDHGSAFLRWNLPCPSSVL